MSLAERPSVGATIGDPTRMARKHQAVLATCRCGADERLMTPITGYALADGVATAPPIREGIRP